MQLLNKLNINNKKLLKYVYVYFKVPFYSYGGI